MKERTLFDKLWDMHKICELNNNEDLLYIDRVFLHERTGGIALVSLEEQGHAVRRASNVFCTMDHIIDTTPNRCDETRMPGGSTFIQTTREAAQREGIRIYDIGDNEQGIVHVISPEQGVVLPGLTVVCPDSHTCTQGAFGALAWGIGSTQAEHALVTSTLRMERPKTMRICFAGELGRDVTAKDMILHLIGKYGASGGRGYAIEFCGPVVQAMGMDARMTLCNMAVEFGAFTGVIAPDETTFSYLMGRPYAPKDELWDIALYSWRELSSDTAANFDKELVVEISDILPSISWGTSPGQIIPIDASIPEPRNHEDRNSLEYMGLKPGQKIATLKIDAAFIGSCTNARLSDLRRAAAVLKGREIHNSVKAICVPGSTQIKYEAEAEGLDVIFKKAGFSWRESGCSMCFFAGGESFGFKERVVSSTNRNFENRQGPQTRTHIASPETVAASAIAGKICSVALLKGI